MFLLNSKLSILAISNQSIRHVSKRALNRLFVGQAHLLSLCLCETNVRLKPSSLEYRLSYGSSQVPNARRTGEEIRQSRAFIPRSSRERDLRKVSRPRHTDLRVGSDQVFLGLANVRASLQQR